MARSVSVLAPNGRRQTVKCTPDTTILQILEEVCNKQGLVAQEYDIKHHNKVLDTSTPVRFSGLPNNAQLELAPALKLREETDVTLALNLEDGTRLTGAFQPSETLEEILFKMCPNLGPNPVVIYTRREIFADDLKKTTLRSLGLTGGRAMLRLIHRSPEALKTQANVSAPIAPKPVEEQPYHRQFQPLEETLSCELSQSASSSSYIHPPENKDIIKTASEFKKQSGRADILKLAKQEKSKSSAKTIEQHKTTEGQESKHKKKETPMEVCEPPSPPKQKTRVTKNHKVKISEPQVSNDIEFQFIGERNAMLFSLESAQAVPAEELPEDFFELTVDDAKKILKDIRQRREELEDGSPLMTSALRELEESKKQLRQLHKYSKAIIRVLFPDRNVLQATFLPTDTVQTIMDFVAQYLHDPHLPFYLYTTPPKSILPKDKKLIEVNCVPGALLHFGVNNHDHRADTYLKKELRNKFTSNSMASLAAIKMRKQATRSGNNLLPNEPKDSEPKPGCSYQPAKDYDSRKHPTVSSSSAKVPKWFKTAK